MKRLIFKHPDGMFQILGYAPTGVTLPNSLPLDGCPMMLLGREVLRAGLIQVEPRFALYREPLGEPNEG